MAQTNNTSSEKDENQPKDLWMVRSCYLYDDEYDDCISFRGRFQQYFVFGDFLDCTSWKHDYRNCLKWKETKDRNAVEKIIASEQNRRKARLIPHYHNPVWEDRTEPPSDWNSPLPDFIAERQKNSFLELKSKELREGKDINEHKRFCVIM